MRSIETAVATGALIRVKIDSVEYVGYYDAANGYLCADYLLQKRVVALCTDFQQIDVLDVYLEGKRRNRRVIEDADKLFRILMRQVQKEIDAGRSILDLFTLFEGTGIEVTIGPSFVPTMWDYCGLDVEPVLSEDDENEYILFTEDSVPITFMEEWTEEYTRE